MRTPVQPDAVSQQKRDKAYDLGAFRILVVEDSPFIGSLIVSALQKMGVGKAILAETIAQGREQISFFNKEAGPKNIDIVILDWLLTDGKGADLLAWVRAQEADTIKYLPVITCSAYASAELIEEGRDLGANEAMVKPVSAEKLAQRILYVIDKPRPFIFSSGFFGPDRRRRAMQAPGEERRTIKPEEIVEAS